MDSLLITSRQTATCRPGSGGAQGMSAEVEWSTSSTPGQLRPSPGQRGTTAPGAPPWIRMYAPPGPGGEALQLGTRRAEGAARAHLLSSSGPRPARRRPSCSSPWPTGGRWAPTPGTWRTPSQPPRSPNEAVHKAVLASQI